MTNDGQRLAYIVFTIATDQPITIIIFGIDFEGRYAHAQESMSNSQSDAHLPHMNVFMPCRVTTSSKAALSWKDLRIAGILYLLGQLSNSVYRVDLCI